MSMMTLIAPSILSADFSKLGEEIRVVDKAGADWIHIDVMDGHFVPNLTLGPKIVADLRKFSKKPFDVHLMTNPYKNWIKPFAEAGADIITIHIEAEKNPVSSLKAIRSLGLKAGISIKPRTSEKKLIPILKYCDLILVMTVNPGFGGQKFMPKQLKKIKNIRSMINNSGYQIDLEVDGGINKTTSELCKKAGANVLVAGNFIFSSKPTNYLKKIKDLRKHT